MDATNLHDDYRTLPLALDGHPAHKITAAIARRHPDHFRRALAATDSVDRALLREMRRFDLRRLSDRGFSARQEILEQLETDDFQEHLPPAFRRELSMRRVVVEAMIHCESLDENAAAALWCGLAVAQDPTLPEFVALLDQWLDPDVLVILDGGKMHQGQGSFFKLADKTEDGSVEPGSTEHT